MNGKIMNACGLQKFVEAVHQGKCPFCGESVSDLAQFRDPCSLREFEISGLCQKCQNKTFGPPKESE